jgi:hypothetical protein
MCCRERDASEGGGRFVADVFYHPTLKDKEDVAEDGFFLNQEVLKASLAKLML